MRAPRKMLLTAALLFGGSIIGLAEDSTKGMQGSDPRDPDASTNEIRVFHVPTQLSVQRSEERYKVRPDTNTLEEIELAVGRNMTCGGRAEIVRELDGKQTAGRRLLGRPECICTATAGYGPPGVSLVGRNLVVEMRLVIFETDVPAQPGQGDWRPETGRYRELWSGTLRADVYTKPK